MRSIRFTVLGAPVGYDRSAARLMFTPREVSKWRAEVKSAYAIAVHGLPAVFHGELFGRKLRIIELKLVVLCRIVVGV